jgi:RNA polymerase sigma-70 factor (ECF subfamily)
MEENDEKLYLDFLHGNQKSFEKIVDKYAENLIYFLFKYVKNIEIAKELSQDVFLYLLVNKEKFRFECSLKTYLYIIAKSRALNYLKKEKNIISFNDVNYIEESIDDLEDIVFENIRDSKLRKAIDKLKPEQRKNNIFSRYRRFNL